MKKLFFIAILLVAFPSVAANTPPPGSFGNLLDNNLNGQQGTVIVGLGLCLSTTVIGCTPPIPPPPPSGALLTNNDGTLILTDNSGNQLTAN
jgi:hypothetical protein